ncbi:MAG: hypothetical protein II574_03570, partial [Ruminococcus sp.]|nr:hypothetical protein [Ruminococcus sp.]
VTAAAVTPQKCEAFLASSKRVSPSSSTNTDLPHVQNEKPESRKTSALGLLFWVVFLQVA